MQTPYLISWMIDYLDSWSSVVGSYATHAESGFRENTNDFETISSFDFSDFKSIMEESETIENEVSRISSGDHIPLGEITDFSVLQKLQTFQREKSVYERNRQQNHQILAIEKFREVGMKELAVVELIYAALSIFKHFNEGIPYLKAGASEHYEISHKQCHSLICAGIFGLNQSERFNFSSILDLEQNMEKFKCVLKYLTDSNHSDSIISFKRNTVATPAMTEKICDASVKPEPMEEFEDTHAFVVFANAHVGQGVLYYGCRQEDIFFLTHADMIVLLLITDALSKRESLTASGITRTCYHTGYSHTFKYSEKPVVNSRSLEVVVMDATDCRAGFSSEFSERSINRDFLKAFCGFSSVTSIQIVSGEWGCGTYGGNFELKALIQLIAASEAKKILLLSSRNSKITERFNMLVKEFILKGITVGDLMEILCKVESRNMSVFEVVMKEISLRN